MNRPHNLITVAVLARRRQQDPPALTYHAAAEPTRTLCGRHAGLALVDDVAPVIVEMGLDADGEPAPVFELWPKHWPSTDSRPVCGSCVNAAELMWRRVDREPNVQVLNDARILHDLARPFTEAMAAVRDELASVGYPQSSRSGGGGVADDTGHAAVTASELVDWIDAVRDVRDEVHNGILELTRLIARFAPKAQVTKVFCGDTQRIMSEREREGWTVDEACGRYGTRPDGLCDRCGKRADRRETAA